MMIIVVVMNKKGLYYVDAARINSGIMFLLDSTNSSTICVSIWNEARRQQTPLYHIRPERLWVRVSLWGQFSRHSPGTDLALHCTSQSILSWRANVNLSPRRQNDVPSLTQLWPSTFFAHSYLVQYDVLHLQLRPSRWVGGSIYIYTFFGGGELLTSR